MQTTVFMTENWVGKTLASLTIPLEITMTRK